MTRSPAGSGAAASSLTGVQILGTTPLTITLAPPVRFEGTLRGGDGDDTYIVDNVRDRAVENSAAGGHDRVKSSVTFWLSDHIEDLILTGSDAIDGFGGKPPTDENSHG